MYGNDCGLAAAKKNEIAELKKQVQAERDKIQCKPCGGKGYIVEYGPCHSSESTCWKCRGNGRHKQ